MTSPKSHVAVIPFPFSSHPTALASLVRRLAEMAGPSVIFSFLNTTSSNKALFYSNAYISDPLPPNVRVYDIDDTMPSTKGKMTTGTITDIITPSFVDMLKSFLMSAPTRFQEAIGSAVRDTGVKVNCLLTDATMSFMCEIAEKLEAKWVALWVPAPSLLQVHIHKDVLVKLSQAAEDQPDIAEFRSQKTLEVIPGLSAIHLSDIPAEMCSPKPGVMLENTRKLLPRADAVVMNSYEEVSPAPLTSDLSSRYKKLFHAGCVTVKFPPRVASQSISDDQTGCLAFLEDQKPSSVVYISFGTIATLSPEEIQAIAEVLEEDRIPYIWSLNERLKVNLPLGFEERMSLDGKIVPWAPQSHILSHPSTGIHITHCGYNAVFESVAGEVPIICKPVWSDNMINARMVEDVWGIGTRIEGPIITKSGIRKCLKMVLEDEEGKTMRAKIKSLKEVLKEAVGTKGSVSRDLESLLELISA